MEEPFPELNTSNPALLNSTWEVNSIYIDEQAGTPSDQQQYYQHKISLLEGELQLLTRNQILLQSQEIKLVDSKDIELSFDRNLREYHMVFHKGKAGESSPQRFHFDNTENGGLLLSKIDTLSSVFGMDYIQAFDMFSTSEGLTPRLLDENKLLRPPNFNLSNARPASPLSDNSDITQQISDAIFQSNYEEFQVEINRLENQILQSDNKLNIQLLKVNQSNIESISMAQTHISKDNLIKLEGILEIKKQLIDVCLQTDPQFIQSEFNETVNVGQGPKEIKVVQKIIDRIIQKIIEVPVETLVIVQKLIPISSQNVQGVKIEHINFDKDLVQDHKQIQFNKEINEFNFDNQIQNYNQNQNQNQTELIHTNQKTRELYNKVISENDFLREQVITLIDQLEDYKKELEKSRSIVGQLEFKISSSKQRDFYKLKLSDLERKISEKTLIFQQLQNQINQFKDQPKSQSIHQQSSYQYQTQTSASIKPQQQNQNPYQQHSSQLIKHYQSTFIQMTQQIQSLKTKIYQLRQKQSSRIEDQSSKISRYIQQIQSRQKQIQVLSKANQQYRSQLQQQLQANGDLRNIVQKLWQQTQQLSSKLEEKIQSQIQLQSLNQEQSQLNQDKQDIDQMNILVSSLTQQITIIKHELFLKQQKQIEDNNINYQYSFRLKQYEQQIEMQKLTIDQFKHTCEKSEQYIMLLNQQIHHLKRLQQKSQNMATLQSAKSKQYLRNSKSSKSFKSRGGLKQQYNHINQKQKNNHGSQYNSSAIEDFKYLLSINNDQDESNQYSRKSSQLNSSHQTNRTQNLIFIQHLQKTQFSSQIIHQLISIVKQTNLDIQTVESQNKYLKNLIIQYQKLLDNSNTTSNPQLSQQQIVNILLQNQRLEKQIIEMQSSNIDINFFEQIVNQLEKTKTFNRQLSQEIEKLKTELLNSEEEIFQKAEAINYLNLALIKTSGDKAETKISDQDSKFVAQLKSQNSQFRQELEATLEINRTLQASIQKLSQIKNYEIHTLTGQINSLETLVIPALRRQIKQLQLQLQIANRERAFVEGQIKQLYKGKKQQHSKSAINVIQKYYVSSDSQQIKSKKKVLINKSMKKLNPIQRTIEQIKGQNLSISTLLYIMYRVLQYTQQKINENHYKLLTPKSVILLNYSDQNPQLIQIMTISADPNQLQQFSSPQVLSGQQITQQSLSWNIGIIFDYLIHGSLFFKHKQQIMSQQDLYFFRKRKMPQIQQIISGLLMKQRQDRVSIERTLQILKEHVYPKRA